MYLDSFHIFAYGNVTFTINKQARPCPPPDPISTASPFNQAAFRFTGSHFVSCAGKGGFFNYQFSLKMAAFNAISFLGLPVSNWLELGSTVC